MCNGITCDKVKDILRKNMFYNAVHMDTLNYMEEEGRFAGGLCREDVIVFADSCLHHANAQDEKNNVYVCPLKKDFDYVDVLRFIGKTFSAQSVSVDIHLLEADVAEDVRIKFSSLLPYRREIKDYVCVAKNETATKDSSVRELTVEDKDAFCDAGFAVMPNRPPMSVLFNVYVKNKAGKILGYFENRKILGYLSYQRLYENVFDIDYIYVSKEQRGRGIGTALGRKYAGYVDAQKRMALWSNAKSKESESTAMACGFVAGRRAFLFS